jgi:transposase
VLLVPRPSHSRQNPADAGKFKTELAAKLEALALPAGAKVKLWMMDEARFGLHTEMRRVWACKGQRPVIPRQTKYQWDYLYGSLEVMSGEAHFLQMPTVNLDGDRIYWEALAATDLAAIHVVIRDQAGFHLRDGDPRLPDRIRTISLPPYSPELNPCEQMWDMIKDQIGNRVYQTIEELRDATIPALKRYWDDAAGVLRLIGRDWIQAQANSSKQTQLSY